MAEIDETIPLPRYRPPLYPGEVGNQARPLTFGPSLWVTRWGFTYSTPWRPLVAIKFRRGHQFIKAGPVLVSRMRLPSPSRSKREARRQLRIDLEALAAIQDEQ